MALTKRTIDRAAYNGDGRSRDVRWDDQIPGFGLRIYPTGRKAFVLNYRGPDRRMRLMTLGRYGVLTLHEGRERARRLLVQVADGGDPLEDRKTPGPVSVAEFVEIFLERHSRARKRSWKEDERRLRGHVVPALGGKLLDAVTRANVAALHDRIGRGAQIEANRVLAAVSTMFSKAEEWGFLPEGSRNPARGVQRFQERSRDRWLKPQEAERLLAAVTEEEDPYVQAALRLYLLTGLRKAELLRARWEDVDRNRKELRLRDTKAGRPHVVPLSDPALSIIEDLPRRLGSPWIFPGKDGGNRKDLKSAWARVRRKADLQDVTLHDLRRTVGSWMAQNGVPLTVIGQVLNHTHPNVTRVYARLSQDQSKEALDKVARLVQDLA